MEQRLPVVGYPKALHFGLLSPEKIKDMSKVHVSDAGGSQSKHNNLSFMDPRMGTDSRCVLCQTCGASNKDCPGHFGHLELAKPVHDYGYMQHVLHLLRCVCPHCSRLLLSPKDKWYKRLLHSPVGKNRMKMLVKLCEKKQRCYDPPSQRGSSHEGCGLMLPTYKYLENVRILVEFPAGVVYPKFSEESRFVISAEAVRKIFEAIKESDYQMLMFDPVYRRPEWMITTNLPVPPICTRPSNKSNSAAPQPDEVTRKLQEIARWNKRLKTAVDEYDRAETYNEELLKRCAASGGTLQPTGLKDLKHLEGEVVKLTNMLQMTIAYYMDNRSISQQQKGRVIGKSNKQTKGLAQKLSHKDGLFRGNLMGKRNDYTSRTVISPDPNIALDEVGVPYSVAKTLTVTETVTQLNIDRLEKMVRNGPDAVFGANSIVTSEGKIDLKLAKAEDVLPLKYGTEVDRHLIDGDTNVFNRQPSLHRMSLMGHKAVILPYSTFRLNPSAAPPYNADFDGDEMNLHPCQHLRDRAEVEEVMMVSKNILNPQSGKPCMSFIQDHLLGCSLFTMRDAFLDRGQVMQVLGPCKRWKMGDRKLPVPAILKPHPLWTGKQIISCLLPKWNFSKYSSDAPEGEHAEDKTFIELTVQTAGSKVTASDLTPTDTRLLIRDGEILSGHLCAKTLGSSQNSLVHWFAKDGGLGPEATKDFIGDVQHVAITWLGIRGFSVGDQDMPVDKAIQKQAKQAVDVMQQHCERWKREKLSDEEIELRMMTLTNDTRSALAGKMQAKIGYRNNIKQMLAAGSKGSVVNLCNITVLTGQNCVEGKRIPFAFTNRVSPHTKQFDDGPIAKGFSPDCLMNGIRPWSYWCYTMAAREGLIDTAVKTSEIGYLQRRLGKASEDVGVHYDGTVRNAQGTVILFSSGEDGMDGSSQEFHAYPPYSMTQAEYQQRLYWKQHDSQARDCSQMSSVLVAEQQRLENDWWLLQQHREFYKSFRSPINFQRIVDNLPHPAAKDGSCPLSADQIASDVMLLQQRLWKDVPQLDKVVWDTKFAQLLRWMFASKRVIHEYKGKMTVDNWVHTVKLVEHLFPLYLAQPGDMVGTVAAQAIGEPGTQMSVQKDTRVVILSPRVTGRQDVVFSGPISDFVDPLMKQRLGVVASWPNSAIVDLLDDDYCVASVDQKTESVQWSTLSQVSRHPANGGLVTVTTASGRCITCTLSHSFLRRGYDQMIHPVLGSNLRVGDRIPVIRRLTCPPRQTTEPATNRNGTGGRHPFVAGFSLSILRQQATPEEAWCADSDWIATFFSGYLEASGFTVCREKGQITIPVASVALAEQLSFLLSRLKVFACIAVNDKGSQGGCRLLVRGAEQVRLLVDSLWPGLSQTTVEKLPGESGPATREQELMFICKHGKQREELDCIPMLPVEAPADSMHREDIIAFLHTANRTDTQSKVTDVLQQAAMSDVLWDPIVSLHYCEDPCEWVYDLTVPSTQTFACQNGILVHNTLNVFHYLNATEKNIPLGIPRLKDIINNAKTTKNPSLTIFLKKAVRHNEAFAKKFANAIRQKHFHLGDVIVSECILYEPREVVSELLKPSHQAADASSQGTTNPPPAAPSCVIDVARRTATGAASANNVTPMFAEDKAVIDMFAEIPDSVDDLLTEWSQTVIRLELDRSKLITWDLSVVDVVHALKAVFEDSIYIEYTSEYSDNCILRIRSVVEKRAKPLPGEDCALSVALLKYIKSNVIIGGIEGIKKTFTKKVECEQAGKGKAEWIVETEGTNLAEVLINPYVDAARTHSNTIKEIVDIFGIEAALLCIEREIHQILVSYNIYVDYRHLTLLANLMCNREKIMGMTRHGMNRLETVGPLIRASFEETSVILKNAARFGEDDLFRGVSSAIIVGTVPSIGTGKTELLLDTAKLDTAIPRDTQPSTKERETFPSRPTPFCAPATRSLRRKENRSGVTVERFSTSVDALMSSFRSDGTANENVPYQGGAPTARRYVPDDLDLHMMNSGKTEPVEQAAAAENSAHTALRNVFLSDIVFERTEASSWRPPSPSQR